MYFDLLQLTASSSFEVLMSKTKSNIFQWLYLFPYCSFLCVSDIWPKSFNLHNTHPKSNHQTLFLYSEKQNHWQTIIGQKFRLTPWQIFHKFLTLVSSEIS